MAYTIVHEGRAQARYLLGPRPFAELLTSAELEQVRRGELVGVNARGDVLTLSSPLEDGAEITLRPPDPSSDFAAIGVPANRRGELVGIPEALRIRQYEFDHGVNLWERPLSESRTWASSSC